MSNKKNEEAGALEIPAVVEIAAEAEILVPFAEFYVTSDDSKTLLAGLKAMLGAEDQPRSLQDWQTAVEEFKNRPVK